LKEVANALSLVANKPGALKYLKSKIGTDEIDKMTTAQFGQAMELIEEVPKLTDAVSEKAMQVFHDWILKIGYNPVDIAKSLNFDYDKLTYDQKNEMTDYIKILKEKAA
jgi:hypothetical protein